MKPAAEIRGRQFVAVTISILGKGSTRCGASRPTGRSVANKVHQYFTRFENRVATRIISGLGTTPMSRGVVQKPVRDDGVLNRVVPKQGQHCFAHIDHRLAFRDSDSRHATA